jgi:iron complex outermembrane receptor protein
VCSSDLLRPQTSRDVEVGARWKTRRDHADLRLYRSSLHDEIGFDPAASRGYGANVNFEPTRRQGVELEGGHALSSTLELRATAAWREAKFVAGAYDGMAIPLVNAASASVGTQWQALPAHRLGAYVVYGSSRHPDLANSCRMPSVTTLDLRWAWELPVVELSLAVANATDRKFYTQAYACASGLPTSIYPEPGRILTAAARLSF